MKKIILSILVCGVLVLGLTGCRNKSNKFLKYLENNNFKCESGTSDSAVGNTCTKNKEVFELLDDGQVIYTIRNGTYHYSISSSKYYEGSKSSQTAIIMTDDDSVTCYYLPDGGSFSYGGEFDTDSTKDICIRYIDKVNDSLRDFEKYFNDAGVELGK